MSQTASDHESPEAGLVSVIVPCFGQAKFLRDCIRSLAQQTHAVWEAIVVDDGSPDDVAEVVAQLIGEEPRVRLVRRPHGGPSAARNSGLAAARGEFVQFLDADDLLLPTKLEQQVAVLRSDPSIDIAYGNAWYFRDGEPDLRVRSCLASGGDEDWIGAFAADSRPMVSKLVEANQLPICAALVRREVFLRAGLFRESLRAVEDWEYWLRCAALGCTFRFAPELGAEPLIRVHASSASHNRPLMAASEFSMRLLALDYLGDRQLRREMLARAARYAQRLPREERAARLKELTARVRHLDELAALGIARALGSRRLLARVLGPAVRLLPWRYRCFGPVAR